MTTANGACIGPEHALNVHRDCPGCSCTCHGESGRIRTSVRGKSASAWENVGTNQDGPGRRANAVIPGPRRSGLEID